MIPIQKIEYFNSGEKRIERYENRPGRLHNDDGPAFIQYNKAGEVMSFKYMKNGTPHRNDGVASYEKIVSRDYTGKENVNETTKYVVNNKLHREDGPAYIHIKNDEIIKQEYRLFGKLYNKQEFAVYNINLVLKDTSLRVTFISNVCRIFRIGRFEKIKECDFSQLEKELAKLI